jgi:putative solute:sodium symporter small subunit
MAPILERLNLEGIMAKASSGGHELHWQKTKTLTLITLLIWYFFSFEIHLWGDALNATGFPGGYFMAAAGSQVVFAILVFWFASRQDRLDREHGVAEKGA